MNFKIEKKGYAKAEVDAYILNLVKNYEGTAASQKQLIEDLKYKLDESEKKNKAYKDKESLVSKAITSAVAKADEIDRLAQLKYTREMQQLKAFHDKWLSYYDKILKKYPLNDELIGVGRFNEEMTRILEKARGAQMQTAVEQTKPPQTEQESAQAKETRIGYTVVTTDGEAEIEEDDILSRDFDPEGRIREYLTKPRKKEHTQETSETKAEETDTDFKSDMTAENAVTEQADYADRSPSGFSFEEALHPQQDLKDIMRDLGLLMDD